MKPDPSRPNPRERAGAVRMRCEPASKRMSLAPLAGHPMVAGGQWRIRTSEGVSQLIYSQSRLAASVTAPVDRHPRLSGGVVTHTGLSPVAPRFVKRQSASRQLQPHPKALGKRLTARKRLRWGVETPSQPTNERAARPPRWSLCWWPGARRGQQSRRTCSVGSGRRRRRP
jgi:hypothetical protein